MAFKGGSSGSLLYKVEVPWVISRWYLRDHVLVKHLRFFFFLFNPTFVVACAGLCWVVKRSLHMRYLAVLKCHVSKALNDDPWILIPDEPPSRFETASSIMTYAANTVARD